MLAQQETSVFARETQRSYNVKISNNAMPKLKPEMVKKWQHIINTLAQEFKVSAGLIMQLKKEKVEVFLKSKNKGNPYKKGETEKLIYGLYCENVIGTQKKLKVADATKDNTWKDNNPDIALEMKSYLGFPLNWPNGEVFGTICVLDNKDNNYNKTYEDLLFQAKKHIETDLKLLTTHHELLETNHKIKDIIEAKSKFISTLSDSNDVSLNKIETFLKTMISKMKDTQTNY